MGGMEKLIVNLLFILFTSFIFQHIQYRKNFYGNTNKAYLLFLGIVQAAFCMSFSIETPEGFHFDLRFVSLIFLGLYGGPHVAIPLGAFIISLRILVGGSEEAVIYNTIVVILQTVIICMISKKFQNTSLYLKILQGFLLSILFSGFIFFIPFIFSTVEFSLRSMVFYTAISILGVIVTIYTSELIQANKILESEIIKSAKISAVSHLAASFSHEIRNPLTSTRGFLQLLQDKSLPDDTRQLYIEIAIRELDHAKGIIEDYLTFAKPHPENLKNLNISSEIHKVIEMIRPLAHEKGIEFEENLSFSFLTFGEQQKFRQCMVNILKNSIEAMPSGGMITLSTGEDVKGFFVEISDSGVGMTQEQVSRLGEPYFTTKGMKGTGLGMMVVFRILESMKATIDINSELGKGTRVIIRFNKSVPFAS